MRYLSKGGRQVRPVLCFLPSWKGSGEYQTNTSASSLYEGVFKALVQFREGYFPLPPADRILRVDVGLIDSRTFYVRVGRVLEHFGREWGEFFSKRCCPECRTEVAKEELLEHLMETHDYSRPRAKDWLNWIS